MKLKIYFLLLTISTIGICQWTDTGLEFSSNTTNTTKMQLAVHNWSGSHGILFNAYKNITVNAWIGATGNTRYANNSGSNSSGAGAILFKGNGGVMDFYVSPASPGKDTDIDWGTPQLRIKRNGNVGIGIDPSSKFTVAGRIKAEEIKVQILNGPDYVFEEEYELRTLEETEEYIKENKHLPEVPTAKEMESNGVDLGEMNMLLLKKIEELTLHTIEQQKMLMEQQSLIEKQGEMINKLILDKE